MMSTNSMTSSSATPSSSTNHFNHNYSQTILNEVKKFYKHINQLNILLKETNNACKELKILQQSSQLAENIENLQINDLDEMFIKTMQKKRVCFVVFGQNVLAQSILVNELLSRYLLPFEISSKVNEEQWRFVRIKHGKIGGYTYQLVDSEFEVMSSGQINKKFTFTTPVKPALSRSKASESKLNNNNSNSSPKSVAATMQQSTNMQQSNSQQNLLANAATSSSNFTIPIEDLRLDPSLTQARLGLDSAHTEAEVSDAKQKLASIEAVAENQAILEVTLDLKLLENSVEILVHSKSMNKSILEFLSVDIIPVYIYGIIENKLSEQDLKELDDLKPIVNGSPILFVKIPEIDKYLEKTLSTSSPSSPTTNSPTTKENGQTSPSTLSNSPPQASSSTTSTTTTQSPPIPPTTTSTKSPTTSTTTSLDSSKSPSSSSSAAIATSTAASTLITQHQKQMKIANNFLKYLHTASQVQQQLSNNSQTFAIFTQLCDLEYLSVMPTSGGGGSNGLTASSNNRNDSQTSEYDLAESGSSYFGDQHQQTRLNRMESRLWSIQSEFCEKWHLFLPILCTYLKRYLKSFSVRGTTILFKFHEYCLSKFINFAFEMARDMLITPRKIEYAREKEQILFDSLLSLASMKQEELKNLINNAIETHREQILEDCRSFQFVDVELVNCTSAHAGGESVSGEESSEPFVANNSSETPITKRLPSFSNGSSSGGDGETVVTGDLVSSAFDASNQFLTVKYARDYKKCTSQIQELVISKLNNAIAQKITESVEILKENYLGTLKRCLITLEETNSTAIQTEPNSASVSEALQQLIKNMPWSASPKLDEEWKVLIASNMLNSLSESKLAKILCNQMKERLKSSHNLFTASLKLLETKHTGRLEKNEENQTLIRKILAPKFAKLCLESTSLKDYVLYGFPSLGREIGRGQYGVVYSCARWGKYENLAVKSVVPPDEKHWNDLALEFHYTKQIKDHERIVKLIGSVIDYTYGNGQSPAVLLIMEAMKRDLYSGLKSGLDWRTRIKISVDVVHGIRYLHSLGLVHRDIKLKNVLLDDQNRAKITDLGFCKPEAMMSGSIVGTPVHMCPEMFNAKYDNTVDIYAFGILFWYICAGSVSLPKNFEPCGTKDDLWSAVKRGIRPERLPVFDEDCWNLMEMCWRHDPKQRPHIGVVFDLLLVICKKYNV